MFEETTAFVERIQEVLFTMSLFSNHAFILLTFKVHASELARYIEPRTESSAFFLLSHFAFQSEKLLKSLGLREHAGMALKSPHKDEFLPLFEEMNFRFTEFTSEDSTHQRLETVQPQTEMSPPEE